MTALDAWDAPELWLLITCALLLGVWAVTAVVERIREHRSRFRHARRCAAAREQMRRECAP